MELTFFPAGYKSFHIQQCLQLEFDFSIVANFPVNPNSPSPTLLQERKMSSNQEYLCIIPDKPGTYDKRIEFRS